MTFSGVALVIAVVVWLICLIFYLISANQLAAVRRHRRKLRRHLDEVNASLDD